MQMPGGSRSQPGALETARAGKISPRGIVNASMEAYTSIARSTLARVLLNTHVMTIVNVMAGEQALAGGGGLRGCGRHVRDLLCQENPRTRDPPCATWCRVYTTLGTRYSL